MICSGQVKGGVKHPQVMKMSSGVRANTFIFNRAKNKNEKFENHGNLSLNV